MRLGVICTEGQFPDRTLPQNARHSCGEETRCRPSGEGFGPSWTQEPLRECSRGSNASSPRGRAFLPRALARSIIPAMEILKIVVLAVGGCLVGLFLAFLQSTHLPPQVQRELDEMLRRKPNALLGFSRAVLVAVVQAAFLDLKNDPRKHFSRNRWQYILWFSAFALLSVVRIVLVELKHNPREFERLENWFLQQWRYPGVFALCLTAVVVSVGRLASFWKRHAQRSYGACEV